VAGANYSLDPQHKIATKLPAFPVNGKGVFFTAGPGSGTPAAGTHVMVTGNADPGTATVTMQSGPIGGGFPGPEDGPVIFTVNGGPQDGHVKPEPKSEPLGKETIAGLSADGTRMTMTIPANAIGNERPLVIVTERWYSSDLQIVLRSKLTNPRFGDTAYEVTKIDRDEPAPSLFEVPSDYKVVTMPTPPALPPIPEQK
jgi:hypothetical protein